MEPTSHNKQPARRVALGELPGLRTFRSARFRVVLAAVLLIIVVALLISLLVRQAADPAGQYGIDFFYWHQAARDVAAGRSPYPERYLEGPVMGTDFGYKYPPTFAQSLLPISGLSFVGAATVWAAIQAAVGYLAVWLAASYGGARPSLERALWSGVAAALYLPIWDSIWKGNVSAVQAFQVALLLGGGAIAGASLASAILLKTTPLSFAPAAAVRRGPLLAAALVVGICLLLASVLAAPEAWLDFVQIQVNLLAGAAVSPTNIHPASVVALSFPDTPSLAIAVRSGTLILGASAVAAAAWAARRQEGWPTAVTLGVVAMLLIPGSAWYHYLAVLLPLCAFAWHRGSPAQRATLFGGTAAVTFGVAWLPLALAGAVVVIVATLATVTGDGSRRAEAASTR